MNRAAALVALVLAGCGGSDFHTSLFGDVPDVAQDAGADVKGTSGAPATILDAGDADVREPGDARALDAGAGGTGGTTSAVVSAGGLRATGGSSSSGGTTSTGGSSSSGGTTSTGGSSSSGGTSATCPANPRTDCPNFCGDVTSRCCSAGHCGCLTDTTQGRVCL